MRISVFGLGYVGAVATACLASKGHIVVGVDVQAGKIDTINRGKSPITEPGLDALVASAVQAVWATDPTWGDLSDVLGLLITAFAVQAGGSVALGQWTGASRSSASATAPPSN